MRPRPVPDALRGIVKGGNSERCCLRRRPNFRRTTLWQLRCGEEQQETIGYQTLEMSFPLAISVRVLRPIIEMVSVFLALLIPDRFHSRSITGALARKDDIRAAIALHCFLQEFQLSSRISDVGFKDFSFVVDSSSEIVPLAADLHEDLVQVPPPLRDSSHRLGAPSPDLVCEVCAEPIDPETDAFVADIDPALMKKVFNVSERQWKSDVV